MQGGSIAESESPACVRPSSRPSLLKRQNGRRSLRGSIIVEVEILEVRGLEKSSSDSSFEAVAFLPDTSDVCKKTARKINLGDGIRRTFMEPRFAGDRILLVTDQTDSCEVKIEVWENIGKSSKGILVGRLEVAPWPTKFLDMDTRLEFRWLRLRCLRRAHIIECRLRAVTHCGTGDASTDLPAIIDPMSWFYERASYSNKRRNCIRIAIMRASHTPTESCYVEVTTGGEATRSRAAIDGIWLETMSLKILSDILELKIVAERSGTTLAFMTVAMIDLDIHGRPEWVRADGISLLVAARADYDETLDTDSRRPFFDTEVVYCETHLQCTSRINALRVAIGRFQIPCLDGYFEAEVIAGAERQKTRKVRVTDADSEIVFNECIELALEHTSIEDDPDGADILADLFENADSEVPFLKKLLEGEYEVSPCEAPKDVEIRICLRHVDSALEIANFCLEAPAHLITRRWYEVNDTRALVAATRSFDASLESRAQRSLALDQLSLAFSELSSDVLSRVLDATRGDISASCLALGAIQADATTSAASTSDCENTWQACNSTDLSWTLFRRNTPSSQVQTLLHLPKQGEKTIDLQLAHFESRQDNDMLVRISDAANPVPEAIICQMLRSARLDIAVTSIAVALTPLIDSIDDNDKIAEPNLLIRITSSFDDVDRSLNSFFASSPFELARIDVRVDRSPLDFKALREGLARKLGPAAALDLPALPVWVTKSLRIKPRTNAGAVSAGVAVAVIATALIIATGLAPVLLALGGLGGGVAAALGSRKAAVVAARQYLEPKLAKCSWLAVDVKHALVASQAVEHDLEEARLFFIHFITHNGSVDLYQRPKGQERVADSTTTLPSSEGDPLGTIKNSDDYRCAGPDISRLDFVSSEFDVTPARDYI